MKASEHSTENIALASWLWIEQIPTSENSAPHSSIRKPNHPLIDPLFPLRQWLNQMDVSDRELAHRLCRLIPAQCPFERDIKLFGRQIMHIPPMCKLNPLYEEVVGLRFRALCFLADVCGEDISRYC